MGRNFVVSIELISQKPVFTGGSTCNRQNLILAFDDFNYRLPRVVGSIEIICRRHQSQFVDSLALLSSSHLKFHRHGATVESEINGRLTFLLFRFGPSLIDGNQFDLDALAPHS